jgi:RNA polymerase sigma-70 factor (ECF subfamily)
MESVEEVVSAAWDAGRAAWPTITLDRAQLATFVAPRAENRQFLADLYLAAACLAGDREALAVFEREVLVHARAAIRSIDANDSFLDEAFQRVRTKLLVADEAAPRIGEYAGRGPLRAWVGIAAVRTALMMRRSVQRAREVPAEDDWTDALTMLSTNNPELDLLKRQYAQAFGAALRDAVAGLEPRLRAALRMSFVEALSIDDIGAVYAVHRATAARWIQRACDEVFEHTRRHLAERLALTGTELDRMSAMVQSQLDVSLSQLLPAQLK